MVHLRIGAALLMLAAASTISAQHPHPHEVTFPETATASMLETELDAVRRATERYRDIDAARADGFVRFGRVEGPLMGEHWYRKDLVALPLDLDRPSTLQYAVVNGERVLVGVAYTVYQRPGEPLPEGFTGAEDRWHVHDLVKIARTATEERPLLRWFTNRRLERGKIGLGDGRTGLTMVHAWIWLPNPDGVFADQHRALPYLRAGLPVAYADGGDEASAMGVALLTDGACETEIERTDWLAKLSRSQKGMLRESCTRAAAEMRAAAVDSATPETLDRAAANAWRAYEAVRDATLTARQHERLATAVEHPH